MSTYIDSGAAVEFYQTLLMLLQGNDAVVFCPGRSGTITVALVDAHALIGQLNEPVMETGSNPYNLLLQVAEQA